MQIKTIKTHKITTSDKDILKIIDQYVVSLEVNSILAVTSKVVSISEGRVVKSDNELMKNKIIEEEAEKFLPPSSNRYPYYLTIKNNLIIPSSGVDESNGFGNLILWPKNAQKTACEIWSFLKDKFKLKNVGVVITDSKTTPLRWGVTGAAIAYCGFSPLNSLINSVDLFDRKFKSTKVNVMDGIASSAVLCMGESSEQTPLAVVSEVPFVKFQTQIPSEKELEELKISLDDDLYASILKSVAWQEGGANK